jgi:hypothetical protein
MGDREAPTALAVVLRRAGEALLAIPRRWSWIPVGLWLFVIWYASAQPPSAIGTAGAAGGVVGNFAHALEYGVLALWLALCVPRRAGWPDLAPRTRAVLLALVVAYALSDEWHQSLTPDRDASLFDVLTDAVGAGLTLAVIAAAAGPRAAPKRLPLLFGWGILACLACALLATFAPQWLPGHEWM